MSFISRTGRCLFLTTFVFFAAFKSPEKTSFIVVDLPSETSSPLKLAVQACAGLSNRKQGGSVYTRMNDKDDRWLTNLDLAPDQVVNASQFLESCLVEFPQCVNYSYANQQKLLPSILTSGAVLDAVPVDKTLGVKCGRVAFDAETEFKERNTPYLATQYVYDRWVNETSGWAMLNPGYNPFDKTVWAPKMDRDIDPSMVDFVYSEKLFVSFLINGCVASKPENKLMNQIASANPWPKPIGVYGYNNSWMVLGGYLFEAQTRCLKTRNMGAIPTEVNNLSFFSTRRSREHPVAIQQNPREDIQYDSNKTYVAFVIGDGDNVAYILDARGRWLQQRLDLCQDAEGGCPPLTWTISPHLHRIAPDVLQWYYEMSHRTGKDYFMLPPSGHLYAYPTSLEKSLQEQFVALTETSALQLGTHSTVSWDWFGTWNSAERDFLPKYAKQGVIKGIFPVNVPYLLPTFTWQPSQQMFKILSGPEGGEVVLFRPRAWRGVDDSGNFLSKKFYLSPENMAKELAGYPRGTVSAVYMTSDGGLNLENSLIALQKRLAPHVVMVSADTAVAMALQASGRSLP